MDDELRFRTLANECRAQAALLRDPATATQWTKIAEEYDRLAEAAAKIRRQRLDEP